MNVDINSAPRLAHCLALLMLVLIIVPWFFTSQWPLFLRLIYSIFSMVCAAVMIQEYCYPKVKRIIQTRQGEWQVQHNILHARNTLQHSMMNLVSVQLIRAHLGLSSTILHFEYASGRCFALALSAQHAPENSLKALRRSAKIHLQSNN